MLYNGVDCSAFAGYREVWDGLEVLKISRVLSFQLDHSDYSPVLLTEDSLSLSMASIYVSTYHDINLC